jgi:hypothetical protein
MISSIILDIAYKMERKMSYGRVLFGLALLSPVLFQPIAVAQPAPQAVDDKTDQALARGEFFPPGNLVALGPFKRTENVPSLSLHVDPHVIEIVKNRNGKIEIAFLGDSADYTEFLKCSKAADGVARESEGQAQQCLVDETSGAVSLNVQARAGRYVVVSESIANDFPIVTHWKRDPNHPRGRREIGGTDAVAGMDGKETSTFYDNTQRAGRSQSQSPLWSTDNALFSPEAPNAELPAYERYPGEGYSLQGLSDDRAKGVSVAWARDTGFSARHLNGRDGCRADVIPEVPFFQVVHACSIGQGDKMSLATLVIPPYWNPRFRYSVLLYPDRDLHYSFNTYAEAIGRTIGQTRNLRKGSAIGVVWNGGAGFGSAGLQRSMYDNATRLFNLLKTSFSADTDKIITIGCSRGAGEALAIAGNPYSHSYKVKEVLAYSPDVAYGTRYKKFTSPTYPALIYNRGIYTGYKYAWREGWLEEQTGYRGWEVILKNTFDTVRPDEADQLSPISDRFLRATKHAGTRINLSIDTHDQYMPFANYIPYVNKAKSYGIPMHVRIHYRGKHCDNMNISMKMEEEDNPFGRKATLLRDSIDALVRVNTGEETFSSEIEYYGRGQERDKWVRIDQQPVAISLPTYVTPKGTFLYSVSGSPGVYFKLEISKMDGTVIQRFSDRLPPMDPGAPLQISTYTKRVKWPTSVPVGSYYYKLSYSVDNTEGKAPYVPDPDNHEPVERAKFEVIAKEPMISSKDFCDTIEQFTGILVQDQNTKSCTDRGGWGLSSD